MSALVQYLGPNGSVTSSPSRWDLQPAFFRKTDLEDPGERAAYTVTLAD